MKTPRVEIILDENMSIYDIHLFLNPFYREQNSFSKVLGTAFELARAKVIAKHFADQIGLKVYFQGKEVK